MCSESVSVSVTGHVFFSNCRSTAIPSDPIHGYRFDYRLSAGQMLGL